MPEVLELTKLVEHHRVPDVDVGRRGVEPELAAQGLARRLRAGELLLELFLDQEAVGAAADGGHGFADVVGHGKLLRDLNTFTHLCPFYSLRAPPNLRARPIQSVNFNTIPAAFLGNKRVARRSAPKKNRFFKI